MSDLHEQAAEYLRKAAALIADKNRWCRKMLAEENYGVGRELHRGYKWCLYQALISLSTPTLVKIIISEQFFSYHGTSTFTRPGTNNHAEVVGAAMHVADIMEGLA